MSSTYIYALIDPNGWVRYVGKGANPRNRLSNHCAAGSTLVQGWARELAKRSERPRLVLLEKCPQEDADLTEQVWIRRFLEAGAPLLNKESGAVYETSFRRAQRVRPSVGSSLLGELCRKHGSQRKIERAIGTTIGVISRWVSAKTRPVSRFRVELERLYGIPQQAWEQDLGAAESRKESAA